MKIEYIYEAGVFGSYKKTNAQSNIDNAKKELARNASLQVLEKQCDELAELYLDMLTEVNSQINAISITYNYKAEKDRVEKSYLLELSNCIANRYYIFKDKDMRLNFIKNVYCNRRAIEYMVSKGCFILPIVDTFSRRNWAFFEDNKEIIPYKNMIKTVTDAADKVIKSHLSKFPSYAYAIPNKVQIVIVRDVFNSDFNASYRSDQDKQLFSYMGITDKGVDFEYPVGQGSSCLNYILDNFTWLRVCNMKPIKSDEHIWKVMVDPSPLMFNKFVFSHIYTDLSTVSADNFYGIKLLKFACDKGLLFNEIGRSSINIFMDNVLKNIQYIKRLHQEISKNGLDNFVTYTFKDRLRHMDKDSAVFTFASIGREITSEKAEQKGVLIDSLKRRVYEFDYKDPAEVESATKNIINACNKFFNGADDSIKQMVEVNVKNFLTRLMIKVLTSKPNCIGYSNKILLCDFLGDYNEYSNHTTSSKKENLRVIIDPDKIKFDKKGNLVFYIAFEFKLPIRGVNPKYNQNDISYKAPGKNYESVSSKIKLEIPLI